MHALRAIGESARASTGVRGSEVIPSVVLRSLALASCLLWSSRAAAAERFADVSVCRSDAAVDCPDREALTKRVEKIRQGPIQNPEGRAGDVVRVKVEFSRDSSGYSAKLAFDGPKRGERELVDSGATCAALADAVSVAVALSLDEADEPEPEPAVTPAPPNARRATERSATRAGATPAPSVAVAAVVEGGTALSFASTVATSLAARAEVVHGGFSFGLGAHAVLASATEASPGRVRASWLFAEAAVCRTWGQSLAFGPCLMFAAGRVHGEGEGYDVAREVDIGWLSAAGGLVLRGPFAGRFEWRASGALWVPLRETTFSLEDGRVVWRSSAVSGVLAAGLGFRFY